MPRIPTAHARASSVGRFRARASSVGRFCDRERRASVDFATPANRESRIEVGVGHMQRERLVDAHGRSRLRRNDEASRASAVGTPPSSVVDVFRLRLLLPADDLDNDVDLRGFLRAHVSVDGAPLSDIILRHKVCRTEATTLDFRHLEGFQRLPHASARRTQRRIEGFGRRARRRGPRDRSPQFRHKHPIALPSVLARNRAVPRHRRRPRGDILIPRSSQANAHVAPRGPRPGPPVLQRLPAPTQRQRHDLQHHRSVRLRSRREPQTHLRGRARAYARVPGGGERGFATPTISRDADAFARDAFARRRQRRARWFPATRTASHDTTSQVDATVIFYLEPETSAGDPDPELYASCSIDTLCSLPSGDDERVVALSARARRAAAAAPPCENYLQAEVAVETAHGWLTTD